MSLSFLPWLHVAIVYAQAMVNFVGPDDSNFKTDGFQKVISFLQLCLLNLTNVFDKNYYDITLTNFILQN